MLNQNKENKLIIISFLTVLGIILVTYNYAEAKKIEAYDYMSGILYKDKKPKKVEIKQEKKEEVKDEKQIENKPINEYIGYLNIPKINLNKGFLDINSPNNTVEKNIQVIEGSDYPDKEKGNLMVAGHSGTGWKAFFNDLYKLEQGDTLVVSYKEHKYIYKIVNIYQQPKIGQVAIYRNYDRQTLTLITCTNSSDKDQTIYISELKSIE